MGLRHTIFTAPALLGALLCLPPLITAAQAGPDRVIGICHLSPNPYDPTSAQNSMSPPGEARVYYFNYEKERIQEPATSVSVLKMPGHGKLLDGGGGNYAYMPDKGLLGNDRATLLVEMGGKKIRMEYFFRLLESVVENKGEDNYDEFCPKKVRVWKISSLTDVASKDVIAVVPDSSAHPYESNAKRL